MSFTFPRTKCMMSAWIILIPGGTNTFRSWVVSGITPLRPEKHIQCFYTVSVFFLVLHFSIWFEAKEQVWNLPRAIVQTEQPSLGPTKRGGLSPDQTEPWQVNCYQNKVVFQEDGRKEDMRRTKLPENKDTAADKRVVKKKNHFLTCWRSPLPQQPNQWVRLHAQKSPQKCFLWYFICSSLLHCCLVHCIVLTQSAIFLERAIVVLCLQSLVWTICNLQFPETEWLYLQEQSQVETSRSTAGWEPDWIDVWSELGTQYILTDWQQWAGLFR